jgi:2-C-methyl-D-erythritol 4-phosphate cytidylyltransferase
MCPDSGYAVPETSGGSVPKATAIILAAGNGTRAKSETLKQLVKVAGLPLVTHAALAFTRHPVVAEVVVVIPHGQGEQFTEALTGLNIRLVEGGRTRNDSTRAALAHVKTDLVLIHDAVRPLVSNQTIDRVLCALAAGAVAVDVVIPSTDTLVTHKDGWVEEFPNREHIHRGQTPQGFRTAALRDAAYSITDEFSDDCQLVHAAGYGVAVVEGDETNIKVTHPGDFAIADRLFQIRRSQAPSGSEFTGRVVVVGGTSGIGAELVTLTGGTALGSSNGFDVTNPDPEAFADADAVVITAGVLRAAPLLEQPDRDVAEMLAVNLGGTIRTARAAAEHLAKTSGHLVLCSSSSYTRGRAGLAVYSATKAAVVALTQALADEWPDIRVNCICPERCDTPMRQAAFQDEPGSLMTAREAAEQVAAMLGTTLTGQVFDIRRAA